MRNARPLHVLRSEERATSGPHSWAETGTSLIELMVAMATGLIVLGATLQALSYFQQQFSAQEDRTVRHQELRLGLDLLAQEFHAAGSGSITMAGAEDLQFTANIHDLATTVTATAAVGHVTLTVEDGRGWSEGKAILLCVSESCETLTLGRDGQRYLLTITAPLTHAIPVGTAVSVLNRVRYYTGRDAQGSLRLMRMVDGGSNSLVDDIQTLRFSYWNAQGQMATNLLQITRVVVEVALRRETFPVVRDMSLRT